MGSYDDYDVTNKSPRKNPRKHRNLNNSSRINKYDKYGVYTTEDTTPKKSMSTRRIISSEGIHEEQERKPKPPSNKKLTQSKTTVRKSNKKVTPKPDRHHRYLDEDDDKEFKKRRRKKCIIRTILLAPLVLIIIGSIALGIKFYAPLKAAITNANQIKANISRDDFELASNTHIYDTNNNEIFTVNRDKNIEYLTYDEIPKEVFDCFIAVEDVRFYKHNGVDFISLARAATSMVRNHGGISQGGSTITQQLVKLTYLTTEQTYTRKISEMIIAWELEKKFTKNEILEFYVNNIYYGNNAYGINSASLEYFNKPVGNLSLSQIAYLCAIPNSPNYYDPYKQDEDGENKNTLKRRDLFLDKLLEHKFITQDQHDKAKAEKIVLERGDNSSKHFDSRKGFVEKEAIELLMRQNGFQFKYWFNNNEERQDYIGKYNDSYKLWRNKFYKKGYKVYTSFDESLQAEIQAKVDEDMSDDKELSDEGIYKHQAATITVDNRTGLILAMIGGRTSPKTDYLNRAYNVQRQNGSTMKPLAVYAPACDLLNYVPSTTEVDEPIKDGPKNSENEYLGTVTIRDALRLSINTVAWKTEQKVTPLRSLKYLQDLKFEYLVPDDNSLAIGLGGMTIGTNVQEVAGGYSTLANGGKFNKPSCITKITDSSDRVLYQRKVENKQVFTEATSALVTDMLKGVITNGTGTRAQFNPAIEIAGKTGTTDDVKDLWFAGYSPEYTTVVWTGYDQPKSFSASGSNSPVSIWRDIMQIMHKDGTASKFEYGDSVKWVNINAEGKEVPEGTEGSRMEIFPKNFIIDKAVVSHQTDVDGFKETLDGILSGAMSNSDDSANLTLQINNVKVVLSKVSSSDLTTEEKKEVLEYGTNIIKSIQALRKSPGSNTNSNTNSNMNGDIIPGSNTPSTSPNNSHVVSPNNSSPGNGPFGSVTVSRDSDSN